VRDFNGLWELFEELGEFVIGDFCNTIVFLLISVSSGLSIH